MKNYKTICCITKIKHDPKERKESDNKYANKNIFGYDGTVKIIENIGENQLPDEIKDKEIKVLFKLPNYPRYLKKGLFIQTEFDYNKDKQILNINKLIVIPNKKIKDNLRYKLNSDTQQIRNEIIKSRENAFVLTDDIEKTPFELLQEDSLILHSHLCEFGFNFDVDISYALNSYFSRRAKFKKFENTSEMIMKNPYILLEYVDMPEFNYKNITEICKKFKISATNMTKFITTVAKTLNYFSKTNGDSMVPKGKFYGYIKPLFDSFAIPDKNFYSTFNEYMKKLMDNKEDEKHILSGNASIMQVGKENFEDEETEALENYYEKKYKEAGMKPLKYIANSIYFTKNYFCEKDTAEMLSKRMDVHELKKHLALAEKYKDVLNENQYKALEDALTFKTSVIIGAAGTGKTYIVKQLVNILTELGEAAILLAPSAMAAGIAAKGISNTEIKHSTIHKFVHLTPEDEDAGTKDIIIKTKDKLLNDNVRFIIVDEGSMCTIQMLHRILFNLQDYPNVHLLILGDDSQLPAIGTQFFSHMTDGIIKNLNVNKLTTVQRTKDKLYLKDFTSNIRKGQYEETNNAEVECYNKTFEEFWKNFNYESIKDKSLMILGSTVVKVELLNTFLRNKLNPKYKLIETTMFSINDPVITTQNCYYNPEDKNAIRKEDILNGTKGKIIAYNKERNLVTIKLESPIWPEPKEFFYFPDELHVYFKLAYALTVHKAQGSEADIVIFDTKDTRKNNLTRPMIYTAVSRAKEKLYVLGNTEDLKIGVNKIIPPGLTKFGFRVNKFVNK